MSRISADTVHTNLTKYTGHWEERTCEEVIDLAGEYIRWYNHSRIKQSLGWKSPVEYRTSQGLAV